MQCGVEPVTGGRSDLHQTVALESRFELAEGEFHTLFEHFWFAAGVGERGFQAVFDREQRLGKAFDCELARLCRLVLGAAADVFHFGAGTQELIAQLGNFVLCLRQFVGKNGLGNQVVMAGTFFGLRIRNGRGVGLGLHGLRTRFDE
ncbi:hypothetical protein GALL_447310 [mine drainage metagenome]|uniref:Uncharacterized protein n=1 Tax=mine drainage metagenome TaxID=410659 RepID=A0A1J5PS55_9ZZZZ